VAPFQSLRIICYGSPWAMPQAGMELRRWRVERGAVGVLRGRCPRLVWVAPLEQVVGVVRE
jgi:hypothetical protein